MAEKIQILDNAGQRTLLEIGVNTLNFMEGQIGLKDKAKTTIIDEAMHVLQRCISPQKEGCITNIAIGYVQSGKTLSFTTLTALAADNGWRIVVYLTGTKTNLQDQTSKRLQDDLHIDESDTYRIFSNIIDGVSVINETRNFLKYSGKILLFPILKHYKHILKLAQVFNQLQPELHGIGCLIIDDEADQSSFNTYAKKNAAKADDWEEDEFSKTYASILELKKSLPNHSYIQYTATPQAAFLIDDNDILSPKYHTVLTPGEGYTGGKAFFKSEQDVIKIIPKQDINDPTNPLTSLPRSLEEALQEFLLSITIVVILQKRVKFLSMMVHIDGRRVSNENYACWISNKIQQWMDFLNAEEGDPARKQMKERFKSPYEEITKYIQEPPSFDEVMDNLCEAIMYTRVHLIQGNSKNTVNWKADKGHILVGADMLNRGFTIENLSMTYMSRTSRGRATADTIEQRCRFFGYKAKYFDICRVFLPQKSIEEYKDYVDHEEILRTSLKQCASLEEFCRHSSSMLLADTLNPTRTNILSSKLVRTKLSGWRGLRSLDYIAENKSLCQKFLSQWKDEEFVLFKNYDNNMMRNHRYVCCDIDKFIEFFKLVKYGDMPNITRKIVTLQYLNYLKETKELKSVYVFEMAYGAKELQELRQRNIVDNKPNNLMAGRAENGSYEGDDKICINDSVCVQIHHIRINQPLHKLDNHDIYNLEFYYPECIANSFVGLEDTDNGNDDE